MSITDKSKIVIIGAGNVGEAVCYTLMVRRQASEIVLVDINGDRAEGSALDIVHGTAFFHQVKVRNGGYEDCADAQIIILTAGVARKPGQTRLELAQTNVNILRSITPNIVKYAPDAIYIMVANPVDIMTYVFHKISGVPANHIIGSGTVLDTARLQAELAKAFRISPKNVHAHVYGEHGDSSFVPWSLATISNEKIADYKSHAPQADKIKWDDDYDGFVEKVQKSGAVVIKAKGATFYAVALSVCHIVKCIFSGAGTALTVSTMMNGEYGIDDVCLSVLCIVDGDGVRGKICSELTEEEQEKLRLSASKLKEILAAIEY